MSKVKDSWATLGYLIAMGAIPNLLFNPYINHIWKPPAPKPDENCKTSDTTQACIVTFKSFEKHPKGGWIMYVEGKEPYQIFTQGLPKNQVGKKLKIGVEEKTVHYVEKWWVLKYWYTRDEFENKIRK